MPAMLASASSATAAGLRVERAVADDFADAVVEIHAGRERQVHAMRAQLGGHQPAHGAGQLQTLFGVEVIGMTDAPRRRQQRELRTEALHAPALLVHGHDQRRVAHRVDIGHQLAQLLRGLVVAREEDDAADERMAQDLAVLGRELEAGDIDHQWAQGHGESSNSLGQYSGSRLRGPFEHRHGLHVGGMREHIKYTGGK